MEKLNPKGINTTALAFLGDAVYEIYARKHVMERGCTDADKLHRMAIAFVRADGQAFALKSMMTDFLTEDEAALAKRARNRKTTSKSRSADAVTYKLATAFEALIGYLYLADEKERMEQVITEAILRIEKGEKNE